MRRVLDFVTNNWALKLAAIGLALLLWMAVRANTLKTATFRNIPVEVDLRDPDWRLVGEPEPQGVHVTMVGTTGDLMTLASNPPRILLPVERVTDTLEVQVLPIQWVQIPSVITPPARVVSLRPDTIRLRYERIISRTLPVRIRVRGELPEGLAVALPIHATPAAVEVRGPARLVLPLDSVPLMPVDVSGMRSTTNIPAAVDTTSLEGLRFNPQEVNVVFRVVPVDLLPDVILDTLRLRRGAPF